MKPLILLFVFYSIRIGHCLRICTRRHYSIISTGVLQRVELAAPETCVERCIENMMYCFVAHFTKDSTKELGLCTLHAKPTNENLLQPDATIDPLSIVFELVDKCPPFASSNITHRISQLHREILQEGRHRDDDHRLADTFFPDMEHVGGGDEFVVGQERYAMMKQVNAEIQVEPTKESFPRDPFTDAPRFHEAAKQYNNIAMREQQPIRPIVLHQGRPFQEENSAQYGRPCLAGADCVKTLYQMDSSPCPARQGDPCAPKPPCMSDDCYRVPPPEGAGQAPAEWSEWGRCTATCGSAIRTRQCLGFGCSGPDRIACPVPPCTSWTLWTPWTFCSTTCGMGEKQRSRTCQNGRDCMGPSIEVEPCESIPCATWADWSPWTGCQQSCGKGIERRSRICQNGLFCPGPSAEERGCDRGPCPHWSPWTPWEECNKPCGGGQTYRSRNCIDGFSCEGASEEKIACNQQPCPEWTQWTSWTVCEEKCGEETFRIRNRKCMYSDTGAGCEGPAQDQTSCPYRECPKWSEWGEWQDCSTTCGQGTQKRLRKCEHGFSCVGPPDEMRFCQIASCPYWGDWSPWSGCSVSCGRGSCERSRKCITDEFLHIPSLDELEHDEESTEQQSEAKQALIARAKIVKGRLNDTRRAPTRMGPGFEPGGGTCGGNPTEQKICDAGPCCIWEQWADWSPCIGCGKDGITKRNRECIPEGYVPSAMPPLSFQEDMHRPALPSPYPPPLAPFLSQPGQYPLPPPSAGAYNLAGLSPIVPIVNRGKRQVLFGIGLRPQCQCSGDSFETKPCPRPLPCEDPTPPCQWSTWGEWCGCSRCRGGREVRRRYCDRANSYRGGPMKPDPSCECPDGLDMEEQNCKVESSCFGGISSYNPGGMSRTLPSQSSSEQRGLASIDVARPSDNADRYVPIDSVIGRVQLNRKPGHMSAYDRKDSPNVYTTTAYPYQVCHWSSWSDWSSCSRSTAERKRFCVGGQELVSNCECAGKSHEEKKCSEEPRNTNSEVDMNVEAADKETGKQIENGLDSLLKMTNEEPTNVAPKTTITSELSNTQCAWTRWSQWSVCTTTCGPGQRMRRRRCPCGDDKCGAGVESDAEYCEETSCSDRRRHPIFSIG